MTPRTAVSLPLVLTLLLGHPLGAQDAGVDFSYGAWWYGSAPAFSYKLAYHHTIFGPLEYGLGLAHLDDGRGLDDRTQTGAIVSLAVNRSRRGPYGFGSWGLGFLHSDGDPDGYWILGAGYSLRPVAFFSLGVEAAYRVEDRRIRGFWQLDPGDRRGFQLEGRLAFRFGRGNSRPRRPAPTVPRPTPGRPTSTPAETFAEGDNRGATEIAEETAALSLRVVSTALDAMGAPYRWGGTDENGYDCSGLIQFAYGEHGILLPRRSRDQARIGELVHRDVANLRPGDILAFTIDGGGISHVGLYVGHGEFIHSTSSGVKLSSLTAADPDSRWWQQRWVTARRILN